MPGSTEKATIKSQFYEIAEMPGIVELVDGTHIRIQRSSEHEADYVNRHFYHSINVRHSVYPKVGSLMCWRGSPVRSMILLFGSSHRLGCM